MLGEIARLKAELAKKDQIIEELRN